MFKRIGLFFMVNILIMITVSIITNLLGVNHYITEAGLDYKALMIFCLCWGMGGSFISLFLSKFMAKTMMGVQIVNENHRYNDLVHMVNQLSKKAGLPKMPEVGVYSSQEINAFATGPSRSNSLVAVSTGLLERMDRDEIEGVIGHELAHVANGDMVTMTLVQGVVNAFVLFFAKIVTFAIDQALRGDDERGGGLGLFAHIAVEIVLQIIFGILGTIFVVAPFSRWREFRADKGSAQLAGKTKMIKALEALQRFYDYNEAPNTESEKAIAAFKISSKSRWFALFSTHPPLKDRIEALKRS